ncbi:MAG: hypothetical protein V8S42_06785 [Lachnospiraceae bacterium]
MEDIGKDTEGIRITWLGTAALKLENKEGTVLIDPFVEMDGAENQNDKEDFLSGDAILDHAWSSGSFITGAGIGRYPENACLLYSDTGADIIQAWNKSLTGSQDQSGRPVYGLWIYRPGRYRCAYSF